LFGVERDHLQAQRQDVGARLIGRQAAPTVEEADRLSEVHR
jgi:hypothetical protein